MSGYTKNELTKLATEPYIGTPGARMARKVIKDLNPKEEYTIGDVVCITLCAEGRQASFLVKDFLTERVGRYDPIER